ncbi:MAG: hypothetical protein VYA30_01365 [Myxococcota bacterium]|nr:hypothetical protein [Myxococcota bacterium]
MRSIILILAVGLLTIGCGSDDGGTDTGGTTPQNMVDGGGTPADSGSAPAPLDSGINEADGSDPGGGSGPSPVDPDEGEPQPYAPPAALTAEFSDPDPGPAAGCNGTSVSVIRGWIVDRIGRPISGAKAQLCVVSDGGTTQCLPPEDSGEDGVFNLSIAQGDQCLTKAAFRVIKPGSGRAPMYCNAPLDMAADSTRIIMETPYVLYAGLPPADLPELGDEMMSRRITFQNGVQLDLTPFDLVSPYEELGMRTVGVDERGLCFLEGQTPPARLYAFTPDSTIYGEATVRFPNETELAPNSKVDISILGGLGCERNGEHVAEGAWESVGTGTVSEDGMHIESDEGTVLTCLTWVGYTPL